MLAHNYYADMNIITHPHTQLLCVCVCVIRVGYIHVHPVHVLVESPSTIAMPSPDHFHIVCLVLSLVWPEDNLYMAPEAGKEVT